MVGWFAKSVAYFLQLFCCSFLWENISTCFWQWLIWQIWFNLNCEKQSQSNLLHCWTDDEIPRSSENGNDTFQSALLGWYIFSLLKSRTPRKSFWRQKFGMWYLSSCLHNTCFSQGEHCSLNSEIIWVHVCEHTLTKPQRRKSNVPVSSMAGLDTLVRPSSQHLDPVMLQR